MYFGVLISFGGSYLWVYQLKTPVEIDEKSLPELATLDNKLTSDKLDLRLQEAAKEQKLKEGGKQENPSTNGYFSTDSATGKTIRRAAQNRH